MAVGHDADLEQQESIVRALARVEEPAEGFEASASIEVRLSQATLLVELDTSGTVDVAAERKTLGQGASRGDEGTGRNGKEVG